MYKLISSAIDTVDLSIGIDRGRNKKQRELNNNKNEKTKHHITIRLFDIFGFVKHQENATKGLRSKLTITWNSGKSVLNKSNATNVDKIKLIGTEWYVHHYTTSISQQSIKFINILNKTPTELQYVKRYFFMK